MKKVTFDNLPKPRKIFSSADELEAAAERAFLRVKAAETLGHTACRTEVKRVRALNVPMAFWESEKLPGTSFMLADLRKSQGWFLLLRNEMQKSKTFNVQAFIFHGVSAVQGVTRALEMQVEENEFSTVIEGSLLLSHASLKLENPPNPLDLREISAALALAPITRHNTGKTE